MNDHEHAVLDAVLVFEKAERRRDLAITYPGPNVHLDRLDLQCSAARLAFQDAVERLWSVIQKEKA